jgi:hypothetical protein
MPRAKKVGAHISGCFALATKKIMVPFYVHIFATILALWT